MRILVTGPSGLVGDGLIRHLLRDPEQRIVVASRDPRAVIERVDTFQVGGLFAHTDWSTALAGVDTVVHLAARGHVMRDDAADPLSEFRRVNVDGTLQLARQALASGVRRFVFVSSIKVNGEVTAAGRPFQAQDDPKPTGPFSISKYEAETALGKLAAAEGMELVIVRPPLVYGPGVRANFRSMMGWLKRGIPLPFGAIDNRRSLVALDNLCDLLVTCIRHPGAVSQTFLVSDGEDISTTDLLRRTAKALGSPARLIPVPAGALRAVARALGKADFAQRLCGSLQVDISQTRRLLGWAPVVRLDDALADTARQFLARADG